MHFLVMERIHEANGITLVQVDQGDVPSPNRGEQFDELWWFWLLLAIAFIAVIIWILRRISIGGPWMRG